MRRWFWHNARSRNTAADRRRSVRPPIEYKALGKIEPLDDLHIPRPRFGDGFANARSLITAIGKDALDERKLSPGSPVEHQSGTVAVLYVGGMDDHIQQQTERTDEDVPFAPRGLLARFEALWIKRFAPF